MLSLWFVLEILLFCGGFASDQNINRYVYANNNPYKYIDRDGRLPIVVVPLIIKAVDLAITAVELTAAAQSGGASAVAAAVVENAVASAIPGGKIGKTIADVVSKAPIGKLPSVPTGPGLVPKADRDPKRFFTPSEREVKRNEQGNQCANGCGTKIDSNNSAGHHIERHADGGKTVPENHAEVCNDCHTKIHNPPKETDK